MAECCEGDRNELPLGGTSQVTQNQSFTASVLVFEVSVQGQTEDKTEGKKKRLVTSFLIQN